MYVNMCIFTHRYDYNKSVTTLGPKVYYPSMRKTNLTLRGGTAFASLEIKAEAEAHRPS